MRTAYRLHLFEQHLPTRSSRCGDEYDERQVGNASHHGCNQSPLAVANQHDPFSVDILSGVQVGDRCPYVVGEIRRSGTAMASGGLRDAPIVVAEYSYSVSGQVVGQYQERLMGHELFVPVLRA